MSIKHSIIIGVSLMVTVLIVSTITFYLSQGPCPLHSFPCDNFTKCVLSRQVCDKSVYCEDMYDENEHECALFYGSTKFLTDYYAKLNRVASKNHECVLNFIPSNCLCKSTALICNHKNLTSIPTHPPAQVTSLFVTGNRLQLTVNSFNDFNLTKNLHMKNCYLEFLPENMFKNQKYLHRLDLDHNALRNITSGIFNDALGQLTSLELLDLLQNFLRFSENQRFPNLPNILELYLGHNNIVFITERLFSSLHHLHYLCLDFNLISTIHVNAFSQLQELRELRIANNHLKFLPAKLLQPMPMLDVVFIGNNEIQIKNDIFQNVNLSYLYVIVYYVPACKFVVATSGKFVARAEGKGYNPLVKTTNLQAITYHILPACDM